MFTSHIVKFALFKACFSKDEVHNMTFSCVFNVLKLGDIVYTSWLPGY